MLMPVLVLVLLVRLRDFLCDRAFAGRPRVHLRCLTAAKKSDALRSAPPGDAVLLWF